jgi:hypothetical protein
MSDMGICYSWDAARLWRFCLPSTTQLCTPWLGAVSEPTGK